MYRLVFDGWRAFGLPAGFPKTRPRGSHQFHDQRAPSWDCSHHPDHDTATGREVCLFWGPQNRALTPVVQEVDARGAGSRHLISVPWLPSKPPPSSWLRHQKCLWSRTWSEKSEIKISVGQALRKALGVQGHVCQACLVASGLGGSPWRSLSLPSLPHHVLPFLRVGLCHLLCQDQSHWVRALATSALPLSTSH